MTDRFDFGLFRAVSVLAALAATSCSRFGPVYPSRPAPSDSAVADDARPARVVAHLVVTSAALHQALDDAAPRSGDGTVHVLGGDRPYTWERGPLDVSFSQGRIVLETSVLAKLSAPFKTFEIPFDLQVQGEPVISSQYAVTLQSVDVQVHSSDTGLGLVDRVANVYDRIAAGIAAQLPRIHRTSFPSISSTRAFSP